MPSPAEDTRSRLLRAAQQEFNERGYAGTDSNKIARRAGFAPQTFYRWFADKTAVFLAVYRAWEEQELTQVAGLGTQGAAHRELVQAILAHHRAHRGFRRSLRQLAVSEPAVRMARAASRQRQIERLRSAFRDHPPAAETVAVRLLQIERLADGLAEEEFDDLGLAPDAVLAALEDLIAGLRPADQIFDASRSPQAAFSGSKPAMRAREL